MWKEFGERGSTGLVSFTCPEHHKSNVGEVYFREEMCANIFPLHYKDREIYQALNHVNRKSGTHILGTDALVKSQRFQFDP